MVHVDMQLFRGWFRLYDSRLLFILMLSFIQRVLILFMNRNYWFFMLQNCAKSNVLMKSTVVRVLKQCIPLTLSFAWHVCL